ncbi:FAD-dependent oxidoreductase [Xanthobacteraceae bacterium Astr-EGSB]|uniref:FAD-dependent oxidoreductase n=1 Tax=Astrobacterium formosum TaxID=3069710 RepID=UPI0027AE3526|nr:FAD-dependent oxidoreductase [Xanthobacteraceae bacterium Astr-EGSB]
MQDSIRFAMIPSATTQPILADVDVLVCGGGMAGVVAAIAAARAGASTLLLERWGFLGGSATAAAIGQFVGWETSAGRRVIGGIAEEIVDRLVARGGSDGHGQFVMSTGHHMDRVPYDPEVLKLVLDELAVEAGVRILFHAAVLDVSTAARTVSRVGVLTKAGSAGIRAKVVVDASGDLDLLAHAGAAFLPLTADEARQPATLMFRFGPIDRSVFDGLTTGELRELADRGFAGGMLARAALHMSPIAGTEDGWFNIGRIAVDATDPFALSVAEMEGRRQAFAAAGFLATHVPGCGCGRLVALAAQLGIRETRRVHGAHVLTGADLRAPARFEDTIALAAYPIDLHPETGADLHFESLGRDHAYEIPFRCLRPVSLDNVLVAGRGISATHEAHAALRVMPTTMAIGQAAGTAAAIVAAGNAVTPQIDIATLQAKLRAAGACLP